MVGHLIKLLKVFLVREFYSFPSMVQLYCNLKLLALVWDALVYLPSWMETNNIGQTACLVLPLTPTTVKALSLWKSLMVLRRLSIYAFSGLQFNFTRPHISQKSSMYSEKVCWKNNAKATSLFSTEVRG